MSVVLPKEIAYTPGLPSLPADTINTSIVLAPTNGSVFNLNSGQMIIFDLPARGFLDPSTLYIRFTYNITVPVASDPATANFTSVIGTPAYSAFSRCETLFGSQIVESIYNYGVVQNMLLSNSLNIAQKLGLGNVLGYQDENDAPEFQGVNGRRLAAGTAGNVYSFPVCAPLNCLIANCEHLYPLFASSNVRIQLTLDSIANIIKAAGTNTTPTVVNLSNVELCFDMVDFGSNVENIVKSMGAPFYIKSESYAVAQQTLPAFQGTAELNFNMRLSSIKSLWAINGGNGTTNGIYDSFDLTQRITNYTTNAATGGGDYSFTIAGKSFPDRPLSTTTNKPSILLECQMAKGHSVGEVGIADNSIYSDQLYYTNNSASTTIQKPAAFFVGVNTEKLRTNNALLSGISTNNSAITYRVNCTSSTGTSNYVSLVAVYDALIEIDPVLRNANIKQ